MDDTFTLQNYETEGKPSIFPAREDYMLIGREIVKRLLDVNVLRGTAGDMSGHLL